MRGFAKEFEKHKLLFGKKENREKSINRIINIRELTTYIKTFFSILDLRNYSYIFWGAEVNNCAFFFEHEHEKPERVVLCLQSKKMNDKENLNLNESDEEENNVENEN